GDNPDVSQAPHKSVGGGDNMTELFWNLAFLPQARIPEFQIDFRDLRQQRGVIPNALSASFCPIKYRRRRFHQRVGDKWFQHLRLQEVWQAALFWRGIQSAG